MNDQPFRFRALRAWGAAFLFWSWAGEAASVPPAPAEPVRVLAFGDSLTAGKDLEDPDAQAYPAVLERLLRAKGYDVTVTNAGVSGDTTAAALSRLDFSLGDKPDVVLVALGSNDTFQGKKPADIERNLDAIVRRCRAAGADVVLVSMKTLPNLGAYYGTAYEKLFPRVAARTGASLAPFMLAGVAGAAALNLPDGIHPNARGYERVAANLLPSVEAAVRRRLRR